MKNESFDLMPQKPPKRIIPWSQAIADNLNLNQNLHANGLVRSGSAAIGPNCCDEEMRERYRI
jgi:hypothetical protein